ncbi:TadE/TadG family type IV pilus assembly protein [Pasteurellaceae bacterium LIM206]|nr:TadE/TadG family type IV pilus assembly protein [Pasteurellaceae bacterium LIM206]
MKKGLYFTKLNYHAMRRFWRNEQGVYTVIMGLLSFVLIGLVALAVDGSGILLDKARFVQGLEQAALALVAENNRNRANQEHGDVNRQIGDDNKELSLDQKQDKRNRELLAGITRIYYLGNSYQPKGVKITDHYDYRCDFIDNGRGGEARTVACEVTGDFDRPSWVYLKDFPLSFDRTQKISSGSVYAQKNQDDVAPLDLMLINDLSGSMNDAVAGGSGSKLKDLKFVVESISKDLLDTQKAESERRNISPHNRIGFISFSLGAAQKGSPDSCTLPFYFKPNTQANLGHALSTRNFRDIASIINTSIDISQTLKTIESFNGTDIKNYPFSFLKSKGVCLGGNKNSSSFWFEKNQHTNLISKFNAQNANGSTFSGSGLLIGANYLMQNNKQKEAQPSELKTNTQRILLVLSDGRDETIREAEITATAQLIENGMCEKIRTRLNSLQDPKYARRESRIAFVAFGYPSLGRQKEAWQKCVGKDYYAASNKQELLETFRQIVGLEEEVGHSLNQKPRFAPKK